MTVHGALAGDPLRGTNRDTFHSSEASGSVLLIITYGGTCQRPSDHLWLMRIDFQIALPRKPRVMDTFALS